MAATLLKVVALWLPGNLKEVERELEKTRQISTKSVEDAEAFCEGVETNEELRNFVEGRFISGVESMVARVKRACGEDLAVADFEFCEGCADAVVIKTLTECVRLARTLAMNDGTRELVKRIVSGAVECLIRLQRLHGGGTYEDWKSLVIMLGRVVTQFITNVCRVDSVYKDEFIHHEQNISALTATFSFAAELNDLPLLSSVTYLLHMLILDSRERVVVLSKYPALGTAFLHGAGVALQELQRIEAIEVDGSCADVDPHHAVAASTHATCTWIVGTLVNCGNGGWLLEILQQNVDRMQMLLVYLSLWLGHRLEEADQQTESEVNHLPGEGTVISLEGTVENSFESLAERLILSCSKDDGEEKEYIDGSTTKIEKEKVRPVLVRLLGSHAMDPRVFFSQPCKRDLISVIVDELEHATQNPNDTPFGYRADLIRAIANLSFQNRANQDAVREKEGGIYTVLNQCGVDDNSPFLREWGIMAIRNLTEENPENQAVIAQLRIQGSVQTSLLEKAGLRVDLTEEGKPKVVRM